MTLAQEPSFGLSPSNSISNSSPDTNAFYDDDPKDLFDFGNEAEEIKPKKSNGRKGSGPGAADKRATHNAIERARRESLNGRFMTLAEALPAMANVKRPSKSIIVNKALDFVYEAQVKEHALVKENNDLRRQVDQLRARLGMAPLPPPAPLPGSAHGRKSPSAASTKIPSPAPVLTEEAASYQQEFTASPTGSELLQQQQQQQQPSPVSSFSSEAAPSPALSAPSSTYSGLPLPSQAPNLNAFGVSSSSPQQQQTLSPFQISGYPSPGPASVGAPANGGMSSTQSLLSQQHTLLLAAHLQQQQQVAQQHQLDHLQQFVSAGMVGGGMNSMAWTAQGLGHGAMWPVSPYGGPGLESYQAFLA